MTRGTIVEVIRNDGTADIHFLFYCDKYIPISSIDQLTPSMLEKCNGVAKMQPQLPSLLDLLATGQVIPPLELSTMTRRIQRTEFMNNTTTVNWILVTPFPSVSLFLDTEKLYLNHIKIRVENRAPVPMPAPAQPKLFSVQDEAVSQCLYIQQGDQYHKVNRGQYYDMTTFAPLLRVLTCNGMFNPKHVSEFEWPIGQDGNTVVTLPHSNIVRCAFNLNQETTDRDKQIEMTFAHQEPYEFKVSVPVSRTIGDPIYFYQPTGVQEFTGWTIITKYRTHLMDARLMLGKNATYSKDTNQAGGIDYLFTIDPVQINMEFFHTMQDVHIYGDISLPDCPMENVVSARFNVPDALSNGICDILRYADDQKMNDLFRLPYVYTINVATGSCNKRVIDYEQINRIPNEGDLPYLSHADYDKLITPDVELLLMQNIMHQMGFTYSKMGDDFLQCPEHSTIIDFYVRRRHSQVVFHFDLTAMFLVSTLSLLFCMPPGMVRPGPMIAPIAYQAQPSVSPAPDVTTFTVKNKTCVILNNAVMTHSTPGMTHLIKRGKSTVPYEYSPNPPEFNFPDMWVSPAFSEEMERSTSVSRSFLRLWHVVSMREEARQHIGVPMQMLFAPEVFMQSIVGIMELQKQWLGARGHTCIHVGRGQDIGPQTISRALASAKVQGYIGGRQATKAYSKLPLVAESKVNSKLPFVAESKVNSKLAHSVGFSKTLTSKKSSSESRVSPKRASTISSMREKISSKLNHFKSIITNADRDVIIGTAFKPSSRGTSRTRRASTGPNEKKQGSATRRRQRSL